MPRPQKKYHYLYRTTNIVNKKFYVGIHSTDDLDDGYIGSGTYLWYSIRKYGRDNFVTEKIKFFDDRRSLVEAEEEFVNTNLINDSLCMNLQSGGCRARDVDDTTKARMSESAKNKVFTDKHRANISIGLKKSHRKNPMSDSTKAKIGQAHKGMTHTEETKKILSVASMGNTSHKGHVHTEETKKKLSNITKEMWSNGLLEGSGKYVRTEECRQKNSEAHKGNVPPNKGKTGLHSHSDEARAKISDASRAMWEARRKSHEVK
jgi:hypothetical protein